MNEERPPRRRGIGLALPVVVILLAFLIYHALNGVRELIIDFGNGALYHKKLFWATMIIGLAIYITVLTAL